jgi:hypothetical protein
LWLPIISPAPALAAIEECVMVQYAAESWLTTPCCWLSALLNPKYSIARFSTVTWVALPPKA